MITTSLPAKTLDLIQRIQNSLKKGKVLKNNDALYSVMNMVTKYEVFDDRNFDPANESAAIDLQEMLDKYPHREDEVYLFTIREIIKKKVILLPIEQKKHIYTIINTKDGETPELDNYIARPASEILFAALKRLAVIGANNKSVSQKLIQERERNLLVAWMCGIIAFAAALISLPNILKKEAVQKFLTEKAPEKVFNALKAISQRKAVTFAVGGVAGVVLALLHTAHSGKYNVTLQASEEIRYGIKNELKNLLDLNKIQTQKEEEKYSYILLDTVNDMLNGAMIFTEVMHQ